MHTYVTYITDSQVTLCTYALCPIHAYYTTHVLQHNWVIPSRDYDCPDLDMDGVI